MGRHAKRSRKPRLLPAAAVVAAAAGAASWPAPGAVAAQEAGTASVEHITLTAASAPAQASWTSYTVQPGDTLSGIAQRFYGNPADWTRIYDANLAVIANPNDIYAGQVLRIPSGAVRSGHTGRDILTATVTALAGTLGCTQLEELWQQGGGSRAEAFTAAEIAMAESGGNQYATGAAGERGYWQINPDHGSLSTYDPLGNARAAVIISADGTNWTPWTTYTSGLYLGRC